MDKGSGRKWLLNAFLIFMPGLFLWILAVVWATSYTGGNFNFLANLNSQLFADYSPDSFGQSMKSLKLAIFGDVFSDSSASKEDMASLEQVMQGLVPTATLEHGALMLTLTPMITSTNEPIPTVKPNVSPNSTPTPNNFPEVTISPSKTVSSTSTQKVPSATPVQQKVVPILDCVVDNGDGTFTAHFSYKNHNSYEVTIPIGLENKFTPGSWERGQPTRFAPGRSSSYPNANFQVNFDGVPLTWHLDGATTTASASSNFCEPIVPETSKDTTPPTLSGGTLNPPAGELSTCALTISVSELRGTDPVPTHGVAWVKFKYEVVGYTGYVYSSQLLLCSGGFTEEGGWDGCYQGSTLIEIDPAWLAPESGPFIINLFAKALDESGNDTCYKLGQYTMPASCGVSD